MRKQYFKMYSLCDFRGLSSGIAEDYTLHGCDASCWGNRIPTFRANILLSSLRFTRSQKILRVEDQVSVFRLNVAIWLTLDAASCQKSWILAICFVLNNARIVTYMWHTGIYILYSTHTKTEIPMSTAAKTDTKGFFRTPETAYKTEWRHNSEIDTLNFHRLDRVSLVFSAIRSFLKIVHMRQRSWIVNK